MPDPVYTSEYDWSSIKDWETAPPPPGRKPTPPSGFVRGLRSALTGVKDALRGTSGAAGELGSETRGILKDISDVASELETLVRVGKTLAGEEDPGTSRFGEALGESLYETEQSLKRTEGLIEDTRDSVEGVTKTDLMDEAARQRSQPSGRSSSKKRKKKKSSTNLRKGKVESAR